MVNDAESAVSIELDAREESESLERIDSLDVVKGLSMIMIILAHLGIIWLDNEWYYSYAFTQMHLDFLGPSMFIILSSLGVVFSVRKKQGKIPERLVRNGVFMRAGMVFVFGIIFELIGGSQLFGWNILMFIGLSQIVTYYAIKLKKGPRALIGIIILLSSEPIRYFLYLNKDANLLGGLGHFLISSPNPAITPLPWISICFFGTIFSELLFETMISGTKEDYYRLFRTFIISGVILLSLGVLIGFQLHQTNQIYTQDEYLILQLWVDINKQEFFYYDGMVIFLLRGSTASMLFNLGADLIIIAAFFYIIDIKKRNNYFFSMLKYYGTTSLTLFLVHFLLIYLYTASLNIVFFTIVSIGFIGFMGFFMYFWMEMFDGIGSPEWLMRKILKK